MVARVFVRLSYRACALIIRRLLHLCAAFAASMPTDLGPSLNLEQVIQEHPGTEVSAEPEVESEEGHREERVEEPVREDVEASLGGGSGGESVILEEEVTGSVGEREEDSEVDMSVDNRPEYWEWAHDWEDLDWSEDIWVEDELVSVDLNEATIPDELWE